jgi:hypothetical protein
VAVLGATLAGQAAGPVLGGTVAAFPTTSATLAISIATQEKRNNAANLAFGLISSLPCFLVLGPVVAAGAPHLGLYSFPIATTIAPAAAALTWRHMNSRVKRSVRTSHVAGARPRCRGPWRSSSDTELCLTLERQRNLSSPAAASAATASSSDDHSQPAATV